MPPLQAPRSRSWPLRESSSANTRRATRAHRGAGGWSSPGTRKLAARQREGVAVRAAAGAESPSTKEPTSAKEANLPYLRFPAGFSRLCRHSRVPLGPGGVDGSPREGVLENLENRDLPPCCRNGPYGAGRSSGPSPCEREQPCAERPARETAGRSSGPSPSSTGGRARGAPPSRRPASENLPLPGTRSGSNIVEERCGAPPTSVPSAGAT
jgi:hypothetical protein